MTPLAELFWWMLVWFVVSVLISPLMGKVFDDGVDLGAGQGENPTPAHQRACTSAVYTPRRIA